MNESETPAPTPNSASKVERTLPSPDRRSFLIKMAAILISVLVGLVPLAIGVFAALDPLRRKQNISGFIRIAPLRRAAG